MHRNTTEPGGLGGGPREERFARSVQYPLATAVASHPLDNDSLESSSEVYRQMCVTFTPAMAHAAYVSFCQLLGQINLNRNLYNTELIEQIHAAYSQSHQGGPLTTNTLQTILQSSGSDYESSSDSEGSGNDSDDDIESDLKREALLRLGPMAAIHEGSGLSKDAIGFGEPSWFVDLSEGGEKGGGGGGEGEEWEEEEEEEGEGEGEEGEEGEGEA